jgi:asparagine synthase (glutamine-hydrolysing)
MCGIAGALDLTGNRTFPIERLHDMCEAIAHRGPDDEHVYREPGVALGARRLAIVDLDGGRQPMCNEDGTIWVAFNGELFEYPELFHELGGRNHQLATRCDTEIWVHLYEDHGEQMLQRTRGQFAVSLWDSNERKLIVARDRFGICPLYYAERDGWLLWASEIKGLLASGLVRAEPDPKGINTMFCLYVAGGSRTCFAGVRAVPPGHYLRVVDGRTRLIKYWDLDFPDAGDELRSRDPKSLINELEDRLRQSVRRRLRGDVPVATYLSGGIDSTLVTKLASQEGPGPAPSFTVSLDGAGRDEGTEAVRSAHLIHSRLTTVRMTRRDIADSYPDLIRAAEMPVVDTSTGCMLRLAEAVHDQGYKVVLSGEGADESLAGYGFYRLQKLQAMVGLRSLARVVYRFNGGLVVGNNGTRRRLPFQSIGGGRMIRQAVYEVVARSRETLFSPDMWKSIEDHDPFEELNLTNDRLRRWHPLNQALYIDYHGLMAGLLVSIKAERVSMNSSVEVRPPFLDEDVVAFCAKLHPCYKLRRFREKWILRKVAERMLPRDVAWRRKYGFRADLAMSFLESQRPDWVDQLLSPESLRATGFFDPAAVARQRKLQLRRVWAIHDRVSFGVGLATVVATQLWHHTFCGGGLADLPTWSPPTGVVRSTI